jgi:NADPH-dependent 2,4-dienoyl-CoA reductase/sulfur reductase-like enzyme
MTAAEPIVIVGAALAGATASQTLRDEGYDGRLVLIGAEEHLPYIRPPLSKGLLAGTDDRTSIDVLDPGWYRDNDLDLRLGTRIARVDPRATTVTDEQGMKTRYDRLLLATGSQPRILRIPGSDASNVHYLRTVDDSIRLRDAIAGGGRSVVLIGSGWIGMEVAATARTLGNEVTILERDPIPLAIALGDELGGYFARLHEARGVRIRTRMVVESIETSDGIATGVRLGDGEIVPADLILVGVGATPQIGLAADAGLRTGNGVEVDASLRTSDDRVFAAGDIANAYHPQIGLHLRSEHWANALTGGAVAARAMLGRPAVHDAIPYFYTDQFDLGMEYSGFAPLTKEATVVYRGDPESGAFIAFWLARSRIVAGMNVNTWDVNETIQELIRTEAAVHAGALQDPDVPLDRVAVVSEGIDG